MVDSLDDWNRRKLEEEITELRQLIATLGKERDDWREVAMEAVRLGKQQAADMDRFWQAIGCGTEETTVDDAIAKWRALEATNKRYREALALYADPAHWQDVPALGDLGVIEAALAWFGLFGYEHHSYRIAVRALREPAE
jgi:hypothetical protein